jgi:hypothetical protein
MSLSFSKYSEPRCNEVSSKAHAVSCFVSVKGKEIRMTMEKNDEKWILILK